MKITALQSAHLSEIASAQLTKNKQFCKMSALVAAWQQQKAEQASAGRWLGLRWLTGALDMGEGHVMIDQGQEGLRPEIFSYAKMALTSARCCLAAGPQQPKRLRTVMAPSDTAATWLSRMRCVATTIAPAAARAATSVPSPAAMFSAPGDLPFAGAQAGHPAASCWH